jgi:transcriptional regulator with XRE-family HTH domain
MAKKPTLSSHLRDARLKRGLTVAEIAENTGVSVASIYLWETGRAPAPVSPAWLRLS